ncbi:hypothetical protein ACTOV4_02795 [Brucella sp. C7-11G]
MNSIKTLIKQIMNLIMKFGIRSGIKLLIPIVAVVRKWINKYFNLDERQQLANEAKQDIYNRLQSRKENSDK